MLRHVSKLKYLLGLAIIIGTLGLGPDPVSAQQGDETPTIQDLIVNGGFEGGFQEEFESGMVGVVSATVMPWSAGTLTIGRL